MLHQKYAADFNKIILPRESFCPFPKVRDRKAWGKISRDIKKSILSKAEKAAASEWKILPATGYMDFERDGDRSRYETVYFERRTRVLDLLLAECLENKGRFLDALVNGIWLLCEETSWVVPAHNSHLGGPKALPDRDLVYLDLFSAETGSLLSWVHYFLSEKLAALTPLITARIESEIDLRVITPFERHDDFWWMGFGLPPGERVNNWNPWIHCNLLTALLVVEKNPERRVRLLEKNARSLDRFMDPYPKDGGCDEGPGYWNAAGAALFDCLELWHEATKGAVNVYDEPLIRNIGAYIYRVHIADQRYVNFADCSPTNQVAGELLIRFGERTGDLKMIQHGHFVCRSSKKNLFERHGSWKLFRLFSGLFRLEKIPAQAKAPLVRDAYFPDTEIAVAREKEGSVKGLFFAGKGGHNAESHNHNDVGSFVLYSDGKPGIIDIGVETYTQKTFGPERYSLWAMRSSYHNLPTVNDVEESAGRSFAATDLRYSASEDAADFSLNIKNAFPEKAGLRSWCRSYHFQRGKKAQLAIREAVDFLKPTRDVFFSFMTVCPQKKSGKGRVILKVAGGCDLELTWDETLLSFKSERIAVTDPKLRGEWGPVLWRMVLPLTKTIQKSEISFIFRQI